MIIGQNSLLTSTNTKDVKELLDTVANIKKEALPTTPTIVQEAKTKSIGDLIESLLKNVAKDESVKQSLVSTLKNSDIPKNIQNSTNDLQTLLSTLKEDKNFQKIPSAYREIFSRYQAN